MILLDALLHEFENIRQSLLQTKTITTLTFSVVQDTVLAEHTQQQNLGGSTCSNVQKISNVKPKGTNPRWQSNKGKDKGKQQESSKTHEQPPKKCHRNRSGKQTKERQAKEVQASSIHSHLASSIETHLQPYTTINGRGTVTEPSMAFIEEVTISIPTKDPQKVPPPATYIGMQPGPSFYEADSHARDLLSCMELPPTPKNLKPLIC